MPWAHCAGWGITILIAAAACGGVTRSGGDDPDASNTQKDAGSQSDSATSGMGKQRVKCSDVSAGGACEEGETCDSDCPSPCQFCSFFSCDQGQWSEGEVFPQPPSDPLCSDAGPDAEGGVH